VNALRVLVTAGPTREHLDDVRFLSNASSGRMGIAVAAAARRAGHEVTLILGPVATPPPAGVTVVPVVSARDMAKAVEEAFPSCDVLVMTAAVSDYRPARRYPGKWKKGAARIDLPLVRSVDIVAAAGRRKGTRIVIGFAVESANALEAAREKMRRKHLDALYLCSPAAFQVASADYVLLRRGEAPQPFPGITKATLARRIVASLATAKAPPPPARRPRGSQPPPPARRSVPSSKRPRPRPSPTGG
jgi:phosphopantothenoylcysteine decarboxylase/phosphopantothenate--cysteine ligase